jgi:hypothetical protein
LARTPRHEKLFRPSAQIPEEGEIDMNPRPKQISPARTLCLAGSAVAFLAGAHPAAAAPITLYNTGVTGPNAPNGSNSTVITGANPVPDPHYTVFYTPNYVTPPYPPAQVLLPPPSSPYITDPNSNWDNDTGSTNNEPGAIYQYDTTFDLTGLDPTTATVSGTVYEDNYLYDILLNGTSTGISGNPSLPGFMAGNEVNFTIPVGSTFQNGINTLDFEIYNYNSTSGTETAFDVTNLRGTANVPEPTSAGLIVASGVGLLGRRHRSVK